MSKPPAFQFYPNDFMDATRFWPAIAVGLYVRCLCIQWTQGGIPSDPATLSLGIGMDRSDFDKAWELVREKFTVKDGNLLKNKRLENVRDRQMAVSKARSEAGKRGANAKAIASDLPPAKKKQRKVKVEDEVEVVDEGVKIEVWPTFEDFWDAYGKKIDRPKCIRAWGRISQKDREAIMDHVPRYVAATPETKYRRNPLTYLNGENWNDDELTRTTAPDRPGLDRARREAERLAAMYADETSGDVTG